MNTITRTTILAAALLLPATTTTMAASAATNYSKKCASCHGKDGSGKTKMGKKSGARDYRDAKVQGLLLAVSPTLPAIQILRSATIQPLLVSLI